MKNDHLLIDLSGLEIADVAILNQDGKGIPEFAASSCDNCSCGQCSCGGGGGGDDDPDQPDT